MDKDGNAVSSLTVLKNQEKLEQDMCWQSDGTLSVSLGHGDVVELKALPLDATVTVTEGGNGRIGYVTLFEAADSDGRIVERSRFASSTSAQDAAQSYTISDSLVLTVTNERRGTGDMGFRFSSVPYWMLLSAALLGGLWLILVRRRREDED